MVTYDELYSQLYNILCSIRHEKSNLESQVSYELNRIRLEKEKSIDEELQKYKKNLKQEYDEKAEELQKYQKSLKQEYSAKFEEFNKVQEREKEIEKRERDIAQKYKKLAEEVENFRNNIHQEFKTLISERKMGFPLLAQAFQDLEKIKDDRLIEYLQSKDRPALTAAEHMRQEVQRRREAERRCKITEYINALYESTFPYITEIKDTIPDITEEDDGYSALYTDEEQNDQVTFYLEPEEYHKLSSAERNQLALDRYKKRKFGKKDIGNMYERYIGYLYEKNGFDVSYVGIIHGFEDMGRDLICKKGNETKIIQCKNWAQYKDIFENSIFQFVGTVFKYDLDVKDRDRGDKTLSEKVEGLFYTTTGLSQYAKEVANFFHIEVRDNFPLDKNYPCIKCNISNSGEKIYHLPFDQQYDRIKINYRVGEFYCSTVNEAEKAGFRRALRHNFHSE